MAKNEYHFVITLQFQKQDDAADVTKSVSGLIAARRGDTRQTLYGRAFREACETLGAENAVTVFFDLGDNDL